MHNAKKYLHAMKPWVGSLGGSSGVQCFSTSLESDTHQKQKRNKNNHYWESGVLSNDFALDFTFLRCCGAEWRWRAVSDFIFLFLFTEEAVAETLITQMFCIACGCMNWSSWGETNKSFYQVPKLLFTKGGKIQKADRNVQNQIALCPLFAVGRSG